MNNETIRLPEWETLMSEAINWEIGAVHTHDEIAEIMALKSRTQKYYNQMQKAIEELTMRGVRLANVKNVGYKVISPDEWAIEAERKLKKGGNNVEEAQLILNHAPLLKMSEETRNKCLQLHDLIIKQKFVLSGGVISFADNQPKKTIQIRGGSEL